MLKVQTLTSAGGIISLLQEDKLEVQYFALDKLNKIVDVFWAEIAEVIDVIEILYEREDFKYRQEAALVASKVYYHLGAFEESLTFALGAGNLFDVNSKTEYVETIISKCIDHYTKLSVANDENPSQLVPIDQRLVNIVNRMFERCLATRQYRQALGIALETRRLDMLEQAISREKDAIPEMLTYATKVCMSLVQNRKLRNRVLSILLRIYTNLENPDYVNMCQCFIFLDDADGVAAALERLIREEDEKRYLMAYQLGFDLYESATQQFLQRVQLSLRARMPGASSTPQQLASDSATPMDIDSPVADSASPATSAGSGSISQTVTISPPASAASASVEDSQVRQRMERLTEVLSGDKTIEMHLQFLIRSNKTDMLILKTTKDTVRNSICHSATVMANGIMHAGTTSDQFLRENLEWLARATNWAKFTATASLGAIHKGHEKEALHLMSTYLPKDSSTGSSYTEGGGLYALGLIYANHGGKIIDYLLKQLRDASAEAVRHGACLGLGLSAMGTARQDVYDQLLANLQQDDAVTGEAAGIAMGLVMLGTKNAGALKDMVAYAQETQHEKILRGLAVGIALTMYGCLEEADALIETLCRDKDPILRWSGMYTMAMAYCGTGNNNTLRRLLHVAVSDVNDDVRRAAVTCVGFLLFRTPEQCPSVVSLLAESYNPNVRYGAAMALGIACAGTGLKEVLSLLETMCSDSVNYVRQGALIASALVLMQHNEVTCPKVVSFRQLYAKIIADKHDDMVAKFGAILAQGIIDAGGRNVTVSLQTRTGHTNMAAVVGLLVFCQFWFWYPLTHFISLAFTPTSLIGLNSELKMPKIEYKSGAKPSTYAYPPPLEEKKDKAKEKVETAVLSITAKQKKKDADKKRDKKDDEKMEVDEKKDGEKEKSKGKDKEAADDKAKVKDDKDEEKAKEEKKEPEPLFEILSNPARVMKPQLRVISLQEGCRYMPMKDVAIGGIVMLRNQRPEDEEQLIEFVASGGPKPAAEDEEDEPAAPEPFEWNDDFLKDL